MRHEVERTSAVDWQNSGGPDSLMGVALWLVAVGGNVLVWLASCALGRGWTLRSFDEAGVLQAKRRYRRRADAEKAMTSLRDQQRGREFDDPRSTAGSSSSARDVTDVTRTGTPATARS